MKSGKITMQKAKCNVADLMIQATEVMQGMADQASVTLVTHPLPVDLWADGDRLLQTLTNLLSNAIKFSEPGGTVWLSAELKTGEGKVGNRDRRTVDAQSHEDAPPPSPFLLITVKDQGRGIPADKLQTIFDRFQQVDASDSRQKGGTGLGLAICRNIIEQHDGKIWVESVPGEGSTFYVWLPAGSWI
jgi:signal transduction histidine kinase